MSYRLAQGEEFEVILKPKNNIRKLYLEITNHCNLQCKMCYRHVWENDMGYMPIEQVEKIIGELESFPNIERVVLGGIGEPTYHPQFAEIVKLFKGKYPLTITTNGTLLEKEVAELIVAEEVAELIISVDSSLEEGFKDIRQIELTPLLEKQKYLKDLKQKRKTIYPRLSWEFVAMRSNITTLPQVVRLGAELGVSTLYVTHMMPVDIESVGEILYEKGLTREVGAIFRRAVNVGFATGINVVLPTTDLKTDRACRFVNNYSAIISWDGEVCPCYRLLHPCQEIVSKRSKKLLQKSYGNIKEKTLEDIWTAPEYMKFRYKVQNNLYPSCTDCDLVDGCDLVVDSELDCIGNSPACGDCLWARGIVFCP
ncbi:MAG: hypothetical protein APF76_17510 [Desulfitibacter sp. BRH_c19]|nr:MAG: hypothetical protein APF76_17510 [Desulfitibacter sp. BRH_c19]